ncbi:MAG: fused MFS/spermidine synthase [Acidobacteriota bacterium]|nr:fused MFS/spermidine synthase [Acidobacteriota bacterium]
MKREVLRSAAIVFIASFCLLVIEIVAGRILAPHVGVSLYTWTSIIGVVLAGISIGAWVGGVLADRYDPVAILPILLTLSAAASFAIVPLSNLVGADVLPLPETSLMLRVLALSAIIFFLPSFLLGTISPVAVKMALRDLAQAGHVVGRIYAVSTVGSILGTFATGFFLIARFGTHAILIGIACVLLVCAAATFRRKIAIVAFLPFAAACVFAWHALQSPLQRGSAYFKETNYFTIRIEHRTKLDGVGKLETMVLDHLVHSLNDPASPCSLTYGYLNIFDELLRWKVQQSQPLDVLFIGGGGYTLPRCIEVAFPTARVDVAEIDPEVTAVAYRFMGLPRNTRVHTANEDARWFLRRSNRMYDIIFGDAFNDISVPYHLTTREFILLQKRHLKPGGVLATNIIDNVPFGDFFPSYLATTRDVFGDDVIVLGDREYYGRGAHSTLLVIAGARGFQPHERGIVLPKGDVEEAVNRRRWTILTDDYAPVDNLLAPLFAERSRYQKR